MGIVIAKENTFYKKAKLDKIETWNKTWSILKIAFLWSFIET